MWVGRDFPFTKQHMRKQKSKGFTLIELLISLVIFSLLVGIFARSFSFFTSFIKKLISPYPEEAVNIGQLRLAINSIFYYTCKKNKKTFYYFFGTPQEIRFITTKPILEKELAVCRIYREAGKLLWEEAPVYSIQSDYNIPTLGQEKKRKILLGGISDFSIEYYFPDGKSSYFVKEKIPALVKMLVLRDGKKREFFFKINSDFKDKKDVIK